MTGRLSRALALAGLLRGGRRTYSPLAYACGLLLPDRFRGGPVAWLRGLPRPRIRPGDGVVELGHVALYPGVRLDCRGRGRITVGDGSYLNRNARLCAGLEVRVGRQCMIAWDAIVTDALAGPGGDSCAPVVLADRVWIGSRAVVLGGTELGEGCVVGAACVVQGRHPPGTVITGRTAREVGDA